MSNYRLWVNEQRTVMVHLWPGGVCEVATRATPAHTWGPPITLSEEHVQAAADRSSEALSPRGERGS